MKPESSYNVAKEARKFIQCSKQRKPESSYNIERKPESSYNVANK